MRRITVFVLMWLPLTLLAGPQEAPSDGAALRERFLARVDEPLVQYRAVRRLAARNERFQKEASLDVATTFDPSVGFQYEVLAQNGSGYVRTRILEPILRGEARAVREGASESAALTIANYEFVPAASDGAPLARLLIHPRRKDILLVDGAILVTPDDADLVRIEGRLARNPSFWTTRVEVRREYARLAGVRVPVRVEARVWVKIAGISSFVMTYEYEEINGRTLTPSSAVR